MRQFLDTETEDFKSCSLCFLDVTFKDVKGVLPLQLVSLKKELFCKKLPVHNNFAVIDTELLASECNGMHEMEC